MGSNEIAWLVSGVIFVVQGNFFWKTLKNIRIYKAFFAQRGETPYGVTVEGVKRDAYPQLAVEVPEESNLGGLVKEINTYLFKTKGTSDYEYIRNKVERKLNMCYEQATVYLSFPTYLGLMGTFLGVFLGIFMFKDGFGEEGITDDSIRNLLTGVLVSMSTSFVGLLLTTFNNSKIGGAKKVVDNDKNEFYDFLQSDVIKTANASLVTAISRLHNTVDRFEPSFSEVIKGFRETFRQCTKAFGEDFRENVQAISNVAKTMGKNMDKINDNIELQKQLISQFETQEFLEGLVRYKEAADRFYKITQSLDKFEEARRMMLAAAQESIAIQNQYNESLKVPREVALRVNQILDRIKEFEENINKVGRSLGDLNLVGNDVINLIQRQVNQIAKKERIVDDYVETSEDKMKEFFASQTKTIENMGKQHIDALNSSIENYEEGLKQNLNEMKVRREKLRNAIEEKFSVEEIQQEFTNLRKLDEIASELRKLDTINQQLRQFSSSAVSSQVVQSESKELKAAMESYKTELDVLKNEIKTELEAINKSIKEKKSGGFWSR